MSAVQYMLAIQINHRALAAAPQATRTQLSTTIASQLDTIHVGIDKIDASTRALGAVQSAFQVRRGDTPQFRRNSIGSFTALNALSHRRWMSQSANVMVGPRCDH